MTQPYFRIGGIGMIMVAIIAPLYFTTWILSWMYLIPVGPFSLFFTMILIAAIALFVGFLLVGIGFYGYYKAYKTLWGLMGLLLPLLFGWTLFLLEAYYFIVFNTFIILPPWLPFPLTEEFVYWLLKDTFLALTPIFWSITFLRVAHHTRNIRRTQLTGALLLASGLAYLPQIILDVYGAPLTPYLIVLGTGTTLFCLAAILTSLAFFASQPT